MVEQITNRFSSPIAEPRLFIAIRPLLLLLYPREINRRFEEKSPLTPGIRGSTILKSGKKYNT
jgi:hypothetical protein